MAERIQPGMGVRLHSLGQEVAPWWRQSWPKRVRRTFKYVQCLGLAAGLSTMRRMSAPHGRVIQVPAPGQIRPATLRTGTTDIHAYEKIFLDGEYDLPVPEIPRFIIDAGANIGFATLFFAARFPEARIVAIEPDPDNAALLRENTRHLAHVTVLTAALWPHAAHLTLENPVGGDDAFQVIETDADTPDAVRAVTIDEILRDAGADQVDILKIDIETAEKELFAAGAETWLDRVRTIMIELHDRLKPGCAASFYRAITRYDFNQATAGEVTVIYK